MLVHCQAGVSRSPSMAIAYLMLKRSWGFEKALAFVKARRKNTHPNSGFVQELRQLEAKSRPIGRRAHPEPRVFDYHRSYVFSRSGLRGRPFQTIIL